MNCVDCQRERAPELLTDCISAGKHCIKRLECIKIAFPETARRKAYQKRDGKKRVFLRTGEWLYIENGVAQILK